ncbi:MAG: tRNA CCA-pyrophosphorylase [Candidimonas sp.]|nr:MAG: tRNA CCA-pyrophosphorylase [Candidimonas sp.]
MTAQSDPVTHGLDAYIVGGAVRDRLLGLPAGDRDWVVVGSSPEEMARRGFIPVGGDFPVFLHPKTKEEYALARTERKSGRGYKGFTFYAGVDVTLAEDMRRRDLTINAIAQTVDGRLLDPLDGQADIKARVLRHVGHSFVEDPVRLLRLARFAARFHDFSIAPQTLALAHQLVVDGEVDALVPERVWREVVKGLSTAQPGRMFQVLDATGALGRVMPGLIFDQAISEQLAAAAQANLPVASRFALLCRLSARPEELANHLRAPTDSRDYARLLPSVLQALAKDTGGTAADKPGGSPAANPLEECLALLERCDALRKPARFLDLLDAAACVVGVDVTIWRERVSAVRSIDAGTIAQACRGEPEKIKAALREARLAALARLIERDVVKGPKPG